MQDGPTVSRQYRWGRFQGISMLVMGIPIFLAAPFMKSSPAYLMGALFSALGLGLVGRKRFGIVLVYVLCFLLGLGSLHAEGEVRIVNLSLTLYFLPPAILYYPKRWREFL